jgi:hypothetical protein
MGPVLEMTALRLVMAALLLGACSSEKARPELPLKDMAKAVLQRVIGGGSAATPAATPDAATVAAGRKLLEEAGKPVILMTDPVSGLAGFLGVLGDNGPVQTWATPEYLTLGLRDGVLISTRGFGADLMSAEAPDLAVLASGAGQYQRRFYYLDGADQSQVHDYMCTLHNAGAAEVTLLGKVYETRRVTEKCSGKQGDFQNDFWFDASGALRQSSQMRLQGVENLQLQRIID